MTGGFEIQASLFYLLAKFLGKNRLDKAGTQAYNVGMKSIQYTIRTVPKKVDSTLRQQARRSGKSLNEVLLEALSKASGISDTAKYDDLDWFIGSRSAVGKSWNQAQTWLDSAPKEIK